MGARLGVARVPLEFRIHIAPLLKAPGDRDGFVRAANRQGRHTFEAPDVGDHLIVITVLEAAAHRFDIAAELRPELVNESDAVPPPARCGVVQAGGVPFVPAGDHDTWRIELQSAFPLFLKVQAVSSGLGRGVHVAVMETPPPGVAIAHVGRFSVLHPQVLRNGNVDHLRRIRVGGVAIGLRIGILPMQRIRGVDHGGGPMGTTQGEDLAQFRRSLLGVAD